MKHSRLISLLLVLVLLFTSCNSLAELTATYTVSTSEAGGAVSESESDSESKPSSGRSYNEGSVPDIIPERSRSSASPSVEIEPHTDFVWKVEGGAGTVHMMGTMHALKPSYAITPEIFALLDQADALAVEANLLAVESYFDMLEYVYYPDYSSIRSHLSERGEAHFDAMCEAYGIDPSTIEMMHAFSLSSSFLGGVLADSDFSLNGVDMQLMLYANDKRVPILELEDYRVYYSAFLALDDDLLERMCILTIEPPEETLAGLEEMYELFLSGDEEAMLSYLNGEYGEEDEPYIAGDGLPLEFEEGDMRYNEIMLDDRNRVMADSIISYIEAGDTVFVAAGLAHFIGENSITDFLEQAGYTITRVNF